MGEGASWQVDALCKHVEEQELPYIEENVFGLVLLWGSEVRLWGRGWR